MSILAACHGVTPHGEILFHNRDQAFSVRYKQGDNPLDSEHTAKINIHVPGRGVYKLRLNISDLEKGFTSAAGFEMILSCDPSKNANDLIALAYLYSGVDLVPKYPGKKRLSWEKIRRRRSRAVSNLQRERRHDAKWRSKERWFKHCALEKVVVRYFWKQLDLTQ